MSGIGTDDGQAQQIEQTGAPGAAQGESESLRDTLTAALKTANARNTEGEGQAEGAAAAKPEARDTQGRFTAKPGDKPAPAAAAAAAAAKPGANTGAAQQAATGAQAAVPAVPKVPDSWSAPMREIFKGLPAEAQAYISQREIEMNKKFTAQDDDRNFGKKIKDSAQPFMATILSEGSTIDQAFQQFLTTAQILRSGSPEMKKAALHRIAQQFSVQLGAPLQQGQQHPMNPQLETIQQRLDRVEREQQAVIQQRQSQEDAQIFGAIEAFAAEPGHDHYDAVKPKMAALLMNGQAKDLQDAYDQAIWADPDIRSTLTADLTRAAAEKRTTEAQARTDGARRAAVSVVGGPGGAIPAQAASGADLSLRDQLKASFREATASRI